jgi:hypothetical protein
VARREQGAVEQPRRAPEQQKPEQKPVEQKPVEQKPAEQKPADQKPVEQKPVESRPANRFGGPDPATFASSDLWEPVIKSAEPQDDWKPAPRNAPAPTSKASPLFVSPHESADQNPEPPAPEEPSQEAAAPAEEPPTQERSEPDEPADGDEDAFVWPEFDTAGPTVAMKPAPAAKPAESERSGSAGSDERNEAHEPA